MYFNEIRKYLASRRHYKNKVLEVIEENGQIRFTISNDSADKYFTVSYYDSEHEPKNQTRPRYYHYFLTFDQDLYPIKDELGEIIEQKWYIDEKDVLDRIRVLVQRYNRHPIPQEGEEK